MEPGKDIPHFNNRLGGRQYKPVYVLGGDRFASKNNESFYHIFQFPDVACPWKRLQLFNSLGIKCFFRNPVVLADLRTKMLDKLWYIFDPLFQWRHINDDDS